MGEPAEEAKRELKAPKTYAEQVEKMVSNNIRVDDRESAEQFLRRVNFHRVSGYMLQWRLDKEKSLLDPKHCVTFEKVRRIYEFDAELRDFLLHYLGVIEINFRAIISYEVANSMCKTKHDQHYKYKQYRDKKRRYAKELIEKVSQKIEAYKETDIANHYKDIYGGKYPIWVLVEVMSFSDLSKYYSYLPDEIRGKIAARLGQGTSVVERDMEALSVLRNCCAHNGRLYNKKLDPPPHHPPKLLKIHKRFKKASMFSFILAAVRYLPTEEERHSYIDGFKQIKEKYDSILDNEITGITEDYLSMLHSNEKSKDELLETTFELTDQIARTKKDDKGRSDYWKARKAKATKTATHILRLLVIFLPSIVAVAIFEIIKAQSAIWIGIALSAASFAATYVFGLASGIIESLASTIATWYLKCRMPPQDQACI